MNRKTNRQIYMNIKMFAKNSKELETFIQAVRIYSQDKGKEFGMENVQC